MWPMLPREPVARQGRDPRLRSKNVVKVNSVETRIRKKTGIPFCTTPQGRGDGVLIYFGYPQAHEDDAERAVRADVELVAGVTVLKSPVPMQTRVGVATGLVVVGDLIGSGASQEQAIVGETPNSRHACKASPSRTRSLSPRARDAGSAFRSSLWTSEPR
jgi:hypothetical protein